MSVSSFDARASGAEPAADRRLGIHAGTEEESCSEARLPARHTGPALHAGRLLLAALDFAIALGRKVGGFCALLTLGWIYFRLLVLGQTLHQLYPNAPDPDLRQTLWVALFLIMAQGWDIPTDRIAGHWMDLKALLAPSSAAPARRRRPAKGRSAFARLRAPFEPMVVHLGRFMDLCVALANKVGALAVLGYLAYLAWQFGVMGVTARRLYPAAHDPSVSLLADICVYVVVLGWWAMPFEQIVLFWRRLRGQGDRT